MKLYDLFYNYYLLVIKILTQYKYYMIILKKKITVLGGNCHQAGNKEKRAVKTRSHKAWSASKQLNDKVVINDKNKNSFITWK